jgi:UrcA family protein
MLTFRLTFTVTSVVALALLGVAASEVAAAGDSAPKQQVVKYADLDVSGPAGATTLYKRLTAAARQVCSGLDGMRLDEKQRFHRCMAEATTNAVAAVGQPALTEMHLAQARPVQTTPRIARTP